MLGTGYNQPEDVKLSVDGVHAYVTERTGDLVKVALASANRGSATVIATGMTAPQQLFLDEAHNSAYVVQYASPGSLLQINLTTGVKTAITSALTNPVGLVLSAISSTPTSANRPPDRTWDGSAASSSAAAPAPPSSKA